ncbi:MAG: zinc ribbon domain-containing protein [Oscillospiraceae bacterium]|nr:zinc ribbon domain-containing protein [Oscillospiraceae bacterium]
MGKTFDDIFEGVKDIAEIAGQKTVEIVDVSKLKIELASINNSIKKCHEKLGVLTYNAAKKGTDSAVIDSCIEELDALYAKRDECREKINEVRPVRRCPNCGAARSASAIYCNICGEKIEK